MGINGVETLSDYDEEDIELRNAREQWPGYPDHAALVNYRAGMEILDMQGKAV